MRRDPTTASFRHLQKSTAYLLHVFRFVITAATTAVNWCWCDMRMRVAQA